MQLKKMATLKRRVLIIANTGGDANYCESVKYDRINYINFFMSPEGGNWYKHEIIAPDVNVCTPELIDELIDKANENTPVFYWVVVFVGHGWQSADGITYLEPYPDSPVSRDMPISWFERKLSSSRCLLIADCCRIPLQSANESVSDSSHQIRFFSGGGSMGYPIKCRQLYNSQILKLRPGHFDVAYAASPEEGAKNLPSDRGGLYSTSLLEAAKALIYHHRHFSEEDKTISLSRVHAIAKQTVAEKSNGKQNPELYYERGYQPPFCVIPNDKHILL